MPLPKTRLSFVFADESEEIIETKLYRCVADEVAFERHYGFTYRSVLPYGAYSALSAAGGVADLDPESRRELAAVKDEYAVFYSWRCWTRAHPDMAIRFDDFIERLASLDVDQSPADALDPTTAAPLPG